MMRARVLGSVLGLAGLLLSCQLGRPDRRGDSKRGDAARIASPVPSLAGSASSSGEFCALCEKPIPAGQEAFLVPEGAAESEDAGEDLTTLLRREAGLP